MATISFDLVSPEKLLFNDKVEMIIVPGTEGDIGVLPGHSKLLSSLRPGRIMVYGENKNLLKTFFVFSGFVEINPEKCIVLAENIENIDELDKNKIQQEIQELENNINDNKAEQLSIAKQKIIALDSIHYNKLQ